MKVPKSQPSKQTKFNFFQVMDVINYVYRCFVDLYIFVLMGCLPIFFLLQFISFYQRRDGEVNLETSYQNILLRTWDTTKKNFNNPLGGWAYMKQQGRFPAETAPPSLYCKILVHILLFCMGILHQNDPLSLTCSLISNCFIVCSLVPIFVYSFILFWVV